MSNLSDIHVIWKDRGYPFERQWAQAFEDHGCKVTKSLHRADASGYVLLQGLTSSIDNEMDLLGWLAERKEKKVAIVINAHKLQIERRKFFYECNIIAGMEFDGCQDYKHCVWIPPALSKEYREDVKRINRPHEVGFRGHHYRKDKPIYEARMGITHAFRDYPEVREGEFMWSNWADYLNTIKAIPAVEANYDGTKYLVTRHFDAVGTKTVQIMYKCDSSIFDETNYIRLNEDESNLKEVIEKMHDETFCEEMTNRTREMVFDKHTIEHRVKQVIDLL